MGSRSVAPSKSKYNSRYTASPSPREANITAIPTNPSFKRCTGRSSNEGSMRRFFTARIPPTLPMTVPHLLSYDFQFCAAEKMHCPRKPLLNLQGAPPRGNSEVSFGEMASSAANDTGAEKLALRLL